MQQSTGIVPFSIIRADTGPLGGSTAASARFKKLVELSRRSTLISSPSTSPGTPSRVSISPPTLRLRPLTVIVRKRPLNDREANAGGFDCVSTTRARRVIVHVPVTRFDLRESINTHSFNFDRAYDEHDDTARIYSETLAPITARLGTGAQATVFAYGQTGSGKSFTMSGLTARAARDVFTAAARSGLTVGASYFEIYCSKVLDLLNNRTPLVLREDERGACHCVGLTEHAPRDAEELTLLLERGSAARSVGATRVNADSSRSHAVLHLLLRSSTTSTSASGSRLVGRLTLVDLAGSEAASDAAPTDRATHHEAAEINKSLLALKECIRAMARGTSSQIKISASSASLPSRRRGASATAAPPHIHVPFRGSKLTQVLRECFTTPGAITIMLATLSPASEATEHTLNTLRYAARLKGVARGSVGAPAVGVGGTRALPFLCDNGVSVRVGSIQPRLITEDAVSAPVHFDGEDIIDADPFSDEENNTDIEALAPRTHDDVVISVLPTQQQSRPHLPLPPSARPPPSLPPAAVAPWWERVTSEKSAEAFAASRCNTGTSLGKWTVTAAASSSSSCEIPSLPTPPTPPPAPASRAHERITAPSIVSLPTKTTPPIVIANNPSPAVMPVLLIGEAPDGVASTLLASLDSQIASLLALRSRVASERTLTPIIPVQAVTSSSSRSQQQQRPIHAPPPLPPPHHRSHDVQRRDVTTAAAAATSPVSIRSRQPVHKLDSNNVMSSFQLQRPKTAPTLSAVNSAANPSPYAQPAGFIRRRRGSSSASNGSAPPLPPPPPPPSVPQQVRTKQQQPRHHHQSTSNPIPQNQVVINAKLQSSTTTATKSASATAFASIALRAATAIVPVAPNSVSASGLPITRLSSFEKLTHRLPTPPPQSAMLDAARAALGTTPLDPRALRDALWASLEASKVAVPFGAAARVKPPSLPGPRRVRAL